MPDRTIVYSEVIPRHEIRRFSSGDETALFRVYFSAIHEIASRDYTQEQINAWAPIDLDQKLWAKRMQDIRPFVVELYDEIVGYGDVQPNGYIDHFFVSGRHSKQGIGSLLIGRIHQEAQVLGFKEMTSNVSLTAQPFFERYGFQAVEQRNAVLGGVTLHNALMRKILF
ncbi:MAG TPA: GNAT family N-acetyltransferase [Eoetvoesiella sp.]